MTNADRKKYQGHWSTAALALKDAFRMLLHTVKCPVWGDVRHLDAKKYTNCDTCHYIQRRLKDTGML